MAAVPDPSVLGELPLFQGLSLDQLAEVNRSLHRKVFPSGAYIITTEEPGEAAYLILSGTVKIHVEQADGSTVILAILGDGEIFGEMSLLEDTDHLATVETLETTTALSISHTAFKLCLESMPVMTYNLVRILSRRLRISGAQVQALAKLDVFGRIARQLLAFGQEYGQTAPNGSIRIPIRLTQTELADLVGASRVRVNQVLSAFKQQQFIAIDPDHRITILNPDALLRRCQ